MVWHASKRMLRPEETKGRLGIVLCFKANIQHENVCKSVCSAIQDVLFKGLSWPIRNFYGCYSSLINTF